MIIFRGSQLSDFNECPRKYFWRWEHEPHLESKEVFFNPSVGTATHNALHLWYKHIVDTPIEDRILFCNHTVLESKWPDDVKTEALRLLKCFYEQYPSEDFILLRPETTARIKLRDFPNVHLQATLDGIIQLDTKHQPVLVLEHKTSKVSKGPIIQAYLRSPQIVSYVWIAKLLGYNCIGGLYNFLVKTVIPDIVRLPAAISPSLTLRWRESLSDVITLILRCREENKWRQNLSQCYTIRGHCAFIPLCTKYNTESLQAYAVAAENEVREDFLITEEPE